MGKNISLGVGLGFWRGGVAVLRYQVLLFRRLFLFIRLFLASSSKNLSKSWLGGVYKKKWKTLKPIGGFGFLVQLVSQAPPFVPRESRLPLTTLHQKHVRWHITKKQGEHKRILGLLKHFYVPT